MPTRDPRNQTHGQGDRALPDDPQGEDLFPKGSADGRTSAQQPPSAHSPPTHTPAVQRREDEPPSK